MIDNNTQFFKAQPEKTISVEGILEQVYLALKEKGYNPVNQIVGLCQAIQHILQAIIMREALL